VLRLSVFGLSFVKETTARIGGQKSEPKSQKPKAGSPKPEADYAINAINAIIDGMASITIRRLPENTKRRLRIRAARNGRSMEQEARELLEASLAQPDPEPVNIGEAIRRRFAPFGGVDLKIPPRRISVRENPFK
jgi:plasmid stability protein